MTYAIVVLVGLAGGALCAFIMLEGRFRRGREMIHSAREQAERNRQVGRELKTQREGLESQVAELKSERDKLDARAISHGQLELANTQLRQDLRNLAIGFRKLELDRNAQRDQQERLDFKIEDLGRRYLSDNVKWVGATLK